MIDFKYFAVFPNFKRSLAWFAFFLFSSFWKKYLVHFLPSNSQVIFTVFSPLELPHFNLFLCLSTRFCKWGFTSIFLEMFRKRLFRLHFCCCAVVSSVKFSKSLNVLLPFLSPFWNSFKIVLLGLPIFPKKNLWVGCILYLKVTHSIQ